MRLLIIMCVATAGTLAAHLLAPANAAACNCIRSGFELVSPAATSPAPTDTRVRVSFADVWRVPVRIVLRDDSGHVIAASQHAVGKAGPDGRRVVEVVPGKPLAPATRYEVVALELGARHVATVVGAFRTRSPARRPALAWAGPQTAACGPIDHRAEGVAVRWPWWSALERTPQPGCGDPHRPSNRRRTR